MGVVRLPVELMHERVAAAAGDQVAVGEEREGIRHHERAGDARRQKAMLPLYSMGGPPVGG